MTLEEALSNLRRSVKSKRISQAYLVIAPPRGVGMTLAHRALSLLFCEADQKPCATCSGCRSVDAHTNPDILWVEPHKKSRIISKELIDSVRERVFHTSYRGGWKACVFVAADRLGPSAANSLLKALEEPPSRTLFLLLTDSPQSILSTVVSRCQRIALSDPDEERLPLELREELMAILADAPGKGAVARLARSDRAAGLLKRIKDSIGKQETEQLDKEGVDVDSDTLDARISAKYREKRREIMQSLLMWYRDILITVCGGEKSAIHYSEMVDVIENIASGVTYRQALKNVRTVENMNRQFGMNLHDAIVFTSGFSQLS